MTGVAFGFAGAQPSSARVGLSGYASRERIVAIIGGGVSGALTAVHLVRLSPPGVRLHLFEKSGRRARGLAYSTGEPAHLVNVRAANMSAFPDRPDHFERWLVLRPEPVPMQRTDSGVFVSREVYGTYLESILMKACGEGGEGAATPIDFHDRAVAHIEPQEQGFLLHLAHGGTLHADAVVLAMGNITRACDETGPVYSNPWAPETTAGLRPREPVLVQGTGLTMIDTLLALRRNGFDGKVVALSRRGLLPQVHAPEKPWRPILFTPAEISRLSAMMRRVRFEVARAAEEGVGWRAVIDGLRPVTQSLWRHLPQSEKARFLRHARPWWDVCRHRIPAGVAEQIAREREAGTLEVIAGRVLGIQACRNEATVIFRARGRPDDVWLDVQRVIQATGVPNLCDARDLLVSGLIDVGAAQLDPLGLGLDVTEDFRVCGVGGWPVPGLWALGPLVRGAFWECVAVPDIRLQAVRLAERIAGELAEISPAPEWMPGL